MIFGQWFSRHETWAEQAKVWMDYLARSSYMLQQGRFVADIAYYYGEDNVIPIYIEVDDGTRLTRALEREKLQEHPKFEEMCRRYLADQQDFSPENLEKARITNVFNNDDDSLITSDRIAAFINGR